MRRFLLVSAVLAIFSVALSAQEPQIGGHSVDVWAKKLKDPEPQTRATALRLLYAYAKDARPLFVNALDAVGDADGSVRLAAANLLRVLLPEPAAAPALRERLKDRDGEVRVFAAYGLYRLDPKAPEAVDTWLACVDDPKAKGRAQALAFLAVYPSLPAKAGPAILKAARDSDVLVRRTAFTLMSRLGDDALPVLLDGVKDTDQTVKQYAISALASRGDAGTPALVAALKDPAIRMMAVNALNTRKEIPREAVPGLLNYLQGAQQFETPYVIQSLCRIKPHGPDAMLEIMKGKDQALQIRLAAALEQVGANALPAAPALREGLKSPTTTVPVSALRAIGALGKDEQPDRDTLNRFLKDPLPWARLAAVPALFRSDPDNPERLVEVLTELAHDPDPELQAEVSRVLNVLGDAAISVLLHELGKKDGAGRERAMLGLETLGAGAAKEARTLVVLLKDPSPVVRKRAARTVAKLGNAAVPVLRDALKGEDIALQRAAAAILADLGTSVGLDGATRQAVAKALATELKDALNSPDLAVRTHAAGALVFTSPLDVAPVLLEGAASKDALLRSDALAYLSSVSHLFITYLNDPKGEIKTKANKALEDGLRDADVRIRVRTAARPYYLPTTSRASFVAVLAAGLSAEDEDTRELAAVALARLAADAAPAAPELASALVDKNPVIRQHAAYVLAQLGPEAAPALRGLLGTATDRSVVIRQLSIQALGGIGPRADRAVPLLVDALKDPEECVRLAAIEALGQVGPGAQSAVGPLVELLEHPAPGYSRKAPMFPFAVGFSAIIGRPKLQNTPAASLILQALARMGPAARDAMPALSRQLQQGNLQALGALRNLGAPAVPVLLESMKKDNLRLPCIMALSAVGPDAGAAVEPLRTALTDADPEIRAQALFALAQVGPAAKGAVPDLIAIAEDTKNAVELRMLAIQALGEIGPDAAVAAPLLEKSLGDADPLIRQWSCHALAAIRSDRRETRRLIDRLRDDPSGAVRQAARRALLKLGKE